MISKIEVEVFGYLALAVLRHELTFWASMVRNYHQSQIAVFVECEEKMEGEESLFAKRSP